MRVILFVFLVIIEVAHADHKNYAAKARSHRSIVATEWGRKSKRTHIPNTGLELKENRSRKMKWMAEHDVLIVQMSHSHTHTQSVLWNEFEWMKNKWYLPPSYRNALRNSQSFSFKFPPRIHFTICGAVHTASRHFAKWEQRYWEREKTALKRTIYVAQSFCAKETQSKWQ